MDGSTLLSRAMAVRKAYTSARMGADSGALGERMRAAGIVLSELDPQYTGHAGAVSVRAGDKVVGAVGVSGLFPPRWTRSSLAWALPGRL